MLPQKILCSGKIDRLPDNHLRDTELDNRTCTEITGHQGGVKHRITVPPDSPCIPDTVDLCVHQGIVVLHPPVMPPGDNGAVLHQHCTNGNTTF